MYWTKAEEICFKILPELKRRAVKWSEARFWYQEAALAAQEVFGEDARRILFVAAALSPMKRAGVDLLNAVRLVDVFDRRGWAGVVGENRRASFHQYGQQVEQALQVALTGNPPTGPKIRPFALALVGEYENFKTPHPTYGDVPIAVIDRHMCAPFFESNTPTMCQRMGVSLACMITSRDLWSSNDSRLAQAAAWHEGARRGGPVNDFNLSASSYAAVIRGTVR